MKKLYKLLILCILILSGGNALKAQTTVDSGKCGDNLTWALNSNGNCEPAVFEDNYYLISNAGNLVWFSNHVNNDNFNANAKLTNDIEMNAVQWTPIGTGTAYNGTFDGQGYTINNLWHNTGVADGGRESLFTLIGSNGIVTNVTLNNATIWGSSPYGLNGTGGIAVRNEGCITNTMVTNSSIQQGAYEYLGGIAGCNKGSITNCAVINSTLTRRWGGTNSGTMGGITQTNNGSVTNCYTYGCMFNNGNDLNSAIVAKGTAPVNSYYYTTDNVADAVATAMTKEQFASGEVAYLLQGEQTTQVWGQNIDNEETAQQYPVFSNAKVYKHTFNGVTLFSNHKTYGKCGDNLYWYVDENNALTIYGTGAMYDYDDFSNKTPWRNLETPPTSLVLEEGITHIGDYAFSRCSGLIGDLTIPNSVTTIGNSAFYNCSGFTGSLTIPNSVTTIGDSAFSRCSGLIGDLTIPNSVTTIEDYAFYNCSSFKGSLTIGNSVTTIGSSAFHYCSGFTGSLTIPNSVTTIENYAFFNCSGLTGDLTIPNSVTTIGDYAFYNCSSFKGSLTIGNSVTTIGNSAFYNCSGFTGSLTIPNSITTIGNYAFRNCSGFTDIFFYRDTNPTIGSDVFNAISSTAKIYAPVIWNSYDNIPEDQLVKMATYTSLQDTESPSLLEWVFPEGMTEVGENDHVAINAPMVLGQQTTDNGQQTTDNILSVKSFGYCGDGTTVNGSITIEDGGQLYCEEARDEVTIKKEIIGYAGQQSTDNSQQTVWYTIASPLKDTLLISDPQFLNSSIPQFLSSNSDLYRYDEPTHTWQNAKPGEGSTNFQTIDPGRGYLYANANDTVLEFTGMINTNEVTYNLTTDGNVLTGFHLVGNPFTHDITFAHLNATEGAELVNGYYVLNGEGAWGATLGNNEDDVIKVGQGALVKATNAGTLAIRRDVTPVASRGQQTTDNRQQSLGITVSNAKHSDRAFVVFDKGVGLDKINHENENIPLLYIPTEDADYAIAMMDINVNEIPVNFETKVMGQYTISLRQDNCEFEELYLYDKVADVKVNILENDYTFIAMSNDNPERFILLKDNGQQTTDNSPWVYVNNGVIVVTNVSGDANINIFDTMGRCVYQGESSEMTARIANNFNTGVYVIQKVDDNGVKVQKIIL
ncbi:MAG: leucine-rich repeat protein [Bacteroidales bacterium]|nr:leucine-rich repeat protein [Bacteroidales bacterium]